MSIKNLFLPTPANNYKAYLISNAALAVYVIILVILNLFFGNLTVTKSFALLDEQQIIEAHNLEREKVGLSPLRYNETLSISAKAKGEAMLAADCWSHYCPDGKSPWDFFDDANYDYSYAGENLAEGFSEVDAVMRAWMNSKTHKENILKKYFSEIGLAIIYGDYQGMEDNAIIVVHFGKPKIEQASAQLLDTFNTEQEAPRIITPRPNEILNSNTLEIKGEHKRDVFVEIDNIRSGRISPEGGIFTYSPEETLTEGDHQVQAIDYENLESTSSEIPFTIALKQVAASESVAKSADENMSLSPNLNLNFINIISIIFISTLIILFVIDYVVIRKYRFEYNIDIPTRSNLHLPTFIVLLVLLVAQNFQGKI
jgi:uncharacterized protein YkwD